MSEGKRVLTERLGEVETALTKTAERLREIAAERDSATNEFAKLKKQQVEIKEALKHLQ